MSSTPRHLLDVTDLSAEEVRQVLDMAALPPAALGRPLDGLGVALIFEKPSNRTRQSMEMAVFQLGGHPVYTRGEEIDWDVREPVEDVVQIMQGYHAVIGARVYRHAVLERMVDVAGVPIVNMLSDRSHPLQAFADALTMAQAIGPIAGKTVAWVGDYNNVARSLGEISALLGAHLRFACPTGYAPNVAELARLEQLGAAGVTATRDPAEAVTGAHAVHTDAWVSMGQEAEAASRKQDFEGYTVDAELMARAAPGAVFMHCLPAHRGWEVTADVIEGPQSVVFQQGHNRLHAARALLAFLMGVRP
jgi:ornithine carbamoyltransferase